MLPLPLGIAQEAELRDDDTVVIHCPEQVDLQVMVDYTGTALGIRFLYGDELQSQRVQLRPSPIEIPKQRLMSLLASLLRVRDLALVEESPALYRIVRTEETPRASRAIKSEDAAIDADSLRMITQLIPVSGGKLDLVAEHLRRFTSSPKGSIVPVPERNLLIVTDYESRVALLRELAGLLTQRRADVEVQLIDVPSADPGKLAGQLTTIMADTYAAKQLDALPPVVRGDVMPGTLVAVGTKDQVSEVRDLLKRMVPESKTLTTESYTLRFMSVDRARKLIDNVVLAPGTNLPPPQSVFADESSGRLFVTAEPKTQSAIDAMLRIEDMPLPKAQRPLRVYRPVNRKAGEIMGTLTQLLGDGAALGRLDDKVAVTPTKALGKPTPQAQRPPSPPTTPSPEPESARIDGPDYVLTVDEATNAILALGTREFHAELRHIIDDLDRKRPQVLIEVTLVAITASDTLDFGIELETLDLGDAWDYLLFTNFGLSQIDVVTGQRILNPGLGGNGVIIGPDEIPIIMRALATRGDAKVISTAKLLVSDNARGTLRNVDEAPFTSVNASDTVATTSFAGFESAGTTLSVTPHIAEGDHLNLEFELSFSNFTGSSSTATVPPPRTTNSFTSVVDVPDGHMVITGGLTVDNKTDSVSALPLIGEIPILGLAFQNLSQQDNQTKIFAFVRPVILREDQFERLKQLSLQDMELAEIQGDGMSVEGFQWMR